MLAAVSETAGQAVVLDPTKPSAPGRAFHHLLAAFVALSPDAKWLATGGWHSDQVRLWDPRTGELVREWTSGPQTRVSFSPDSRELIFGRGGEFRFVDVASLEPTRAVRREVGLYPGDAAFSPDGRLIAMELAPGVIHLKESVTARTVAQLTDPFGDRSGWHMFAADGTKLIVVASSGALHVWDLRVIRARLKPMGLDWNWPEFLPAESDEMRPSPSRSAAKIRVLAGDAR